MSAANPNRIHLCVGETTFGCPFGAVTSVTPIHFGGNGHTPHIEARFVGGMRMSFTPAAFTELLRGGQEALTLLPVFPELHDATGGAE